MNLIQELKDKLDKLDLWQDSQCLSRNEYLKVKGSADTNLYFVVSGSLRVFIEDEFEDHTIRFGYKGSFICCFGFFYNRKTL